MATALDCFSAAARAYREEHQACLHCRQSHCVFHTATAEIEEYRCYRCGHFLAFHRTQGTYILGQDTPDHLDTVFDDGPGLLAHLEDHPALRLG